MKDYTEMLTKEDKEKEKKGIIKSKKEYKKKVYPIRERVNINGRNRRKRAKKIYKIR